MNRKLVLALALTLLVGLLSVAFNVQRAKATGTIYIRADGSIDPPTTPISTLDNVTYTFTGNINDSIVVERDNIVLDGATYTVQGTGIYYSKGIDLSTRSNVTIKNTTIKNYGYGIYLYDSLNNHISGNNIGTLNENGIMLINSTGNSISGNNITYNLPGAGIIFFSSSNSSIVGNNITYNQYGIYFSFGCSGNSISGNKFINNGLFVSDSYQTSVENNTVNGKPLVYLEEASDYTVDDAGQVVLVRCENIRVEGLNLSGIDDGIELWETSNSTISGNNIANSKWYAIRLESSSNYNIISGNNIGAYNYFGIRLESSSNNSISENNIINNTYGIELDGSLNNISGNNIMNNFRGIKLSSSNNGIFHNNFVNNNKQVFFFTPDCTDVWDEDYPSGGNYWSDYNGTDANHDGIGDSEYTVGRHVIDADDNNDRYPLMGMFTGFNANSEYHVQTICNSTISDFQYNGTAMSFDVSGENGTTGFCRICIPTALMNATYRVFVNGTEVSYNLLLSSNEAYSYVYFNYTHSTQEVIIIPEFPSFLILPLFMTLAVFAACVKRKTMRRQSG
jgi:parallel beta-helix repeat protein